MCYNMIERNLMTLKKPNFTTKLKLNNSSMVRLQYSTSTSRLVESSYINQLTVAYKNHDFIKNFFQICFMNKKCICLTCKLENIQQLKSLKVIVHMVR
jgi:hypothetical protein